MTAVRSRIESWDCIPRLFLLLGGYKLNEIIYTTPEEQINKLKSQNLIIRDEELAKDVLSLFGYSNLIKSYREPYMIISEGKKIYRSGVSFDQLCSLYRLDKALRNAVMASMLDLEEHIKEAAADVVANAFGTHPDEYLKYKNYSNKRKKQKQFSLSEILETMKKTLNSGKDPILHYRTVHGIVPPWILFKSVYFSTIINFIDQFKISQKDEMVEKLYDTTMLNLSPESARKLMMDTLAICMEYRNLAAHGGRTYNYICNSKLRINEIFNTNVESEIAGFSQLLFLLSLLDYQNPYRNLSAALTSELDRHCNHYPQDTTYLGQILNVNIVSTQIVWVSDKSSKYHSNPHCSGLKNAKELELEKAEKQGYIPCKRCN